MSRRAGLDRCYAGAVLDRTGWLVISSILSLIPLAEPAALAGESRRQLKPTKPPSSAKAPTSNAPAHKPVAHRRTQDQRTVPVGRSKVTGTKPAGTHARASGTQTQNTNRRPQRGITAGKSATGLPLQAAPKPPKVSANQTATAKRGPHPHRSYTTQATAGRRPHREKLQADIRRRTEQARLAELARIRALDDSLHRATQANIAQDDLRGEDPTIRRIALDALGDRAGTVIVLDPGTGRVFSIVNQQWAVRTLFKPCSTIKVLTAYAALQEGLVTADEPITAGRQTWTLQTAMARSNNEYFQVLGRRLGFERMVAYARRAGFGRPTGINLAGESSGVVPQLPPADLGRIGSHGDGFGITPIQLAIFMSAIANGGTLYRPQILRTPREQTTFKPIPVRTLPLSEEQRRDLLAGLLSAVEHGTARRSGASAFGVAGKTGSCNCDFGVRTRVGLFVSFVDAPGRPELLVTVITKGSTARGSGASIIAGDVYRGTSIAVRTKTRQRLASDTADVAFDDDDEAATD